MNIVSEKEIEIDESIFRVSLMSDNIVHIVGDGLYFGQGIWDDKFNCLEEKDPILDFVTTKEFDKLDETVRFMKKYN